MSTVRLIAAPYTQMQLRQNHQEYRSHAGCFKLLLTDNMVQLRL